LNDDDSACVVIELAANLDHQLTKQPAGASRQELNENKVQIEKSKNSLMIENIKERKVFQFQSSYYYCYCTVVTITGNSVCSTNDFCRVLLYQLSSVLFCHVCVTYTLAKSFMCNIREW